MKKTELKIELAKLTISAIILGVVLAAIFAKFSWFTVIALLAGSCATYLPLRSIYSKCQTNVNCEDE